MRKASFHGGRHAKGLMHPAEIMIGMVDRNLNPLKFQNSPLPGATLECLVPHPFRCLRQGGIVTLRISIRVPAASHGILLYHDALNAKSQNPTPVPAENAATRTGQPDCTCRPEVS